MLFYTERHSFVHCLINVVSFASAMGARERALSILFFIAVMALCTWPETNREHVCTWESVRVKEWAEKADISRKRYCVISWKWFFEFWKGIKCAIKRRMGFLLKFFFEIKWQTIWYLSSSTHTHAQMRIRIYYHACMHACIQTTKQRFSSQRTKWMKTKTKKKLWGFWWPKFLSLCGFIYCHIKCAYVHICLHSISYTKHHTMLVREMHKDT